MTAGHNAFREDERLHAASAERLIAIDAAIKARGSFA
jgi:hypothetical protein